ncbi:hypothetical protein L873DRAFT_422265 [Choiromyces venosus 120613-1]|uniref:Uncharacterized protein n=1 Tax=Choiromyces venosus 120613-1 TaxID=1336337 RepID=A0A3N4JW97_9PEZI|nr:hypothetical protein L873DRAFT_422265 [Choiromyces venosus 120613-1]
MQFKAFIFFSFLTLPFVGSFFTSYWFLLLLFSFFINFHLFLPSHTVESGHIETIAKLVAQKIDIKLYYIRRKKRK